MKIQNTIKAFEIDLLKMPYLIFLIAIIIFSRVWLLDLGYGLDADAWRIANSAFDMRYHGIYHASHHETH